VKYFSYFLLFLFIGCSSKSSFEINKNNILTIIQENNLNKQIIKTKQFQIFTAHKDLNQCENERVYIYIEGDGLAWRTKNQVSNNPTPSNPVSLHIMNSVNQKCSIYLARPCQYTTQVCNKKYWTSHRYSYNIIQSYNELIDNIKSTYKIKDFVVVGYSGGGAIATLLATQRKDIDSIITIASNIDTLAWTSYHGITPLYGSLNPADFTYLLKNIQQYYLVGIEDNTVPPIVFESFKKHTKNPYNLHRYMYKTNHYTNWDTIYKDFFYNIYLPNKKTK